MGIGDWAQSQNPKLAKIKEDYNKIIKNKQNKCDKLKELKKLLISVIFSKNIIKNI